MSGSQKLFTFIIITAFSAAVVALGAHELNQRFKSGAFEDEDGGRSILAEWRGYNPDEARAQPKGLARFFPEGYDPSAEGDD